MIMYNRNGSASHLGWPFCMLLSPQPFIGRWHVAARIQRSWPSSLRQFSTSSIGFVKLNFNVGAGDSLQLRARVFDTSLGKAFLASAPHEIHRLSSYGAEVYGPLRLALPSISVQPRIPSGGVAYSESGNYLCIFYGQVPAWPVDYIAQIDEGWESLQGGNWRDLIVREEV